MDKSSHRINLKKQGKWANRWVRFWMRYAGARGLGRLAARLATWMAPPHKAQVRLAKMNARGFISPSAQIHHSDLHLGANVYLGDRVIIYQAENGGPVQMGDRAVFLRDTIIESGYGGSLLVGAEAYIHPRCQFNAHKANIRIGSGVMVAANCVFYPHNHGLSPDRPIREQPLQTNGDIVVGDEAWLGTGVIVLGGVTIGEGAVVGAGAVVTGDIPDGAIAVGVPARVVKMRSDVVQRNGASPSSVTAHES